MTRTPAGIDRVLAAGEFCHLAARTPAGPHLTPAVFAMSGGRLWATTSRGSVKARAWRADPTVAGLVRLGDDAVSFSGDARLYDLLDAGTWPDVLANGAAVTAASLRFSRKNARFFAGYAVDARHVPFAWAPPGRVFVEVRIDAAVLLRSGDVVETLGAVEAEDAAETIAPRAGYRSIATADAFVALPAHVRRALGTRGHGALALDAGVRPAVLPVRWAVGGGPILAATPARDPGLTRAGPTARPGAPAAIAIDRPSRWRARRMLGCMVQGSADVFHPGTVRSGRRALASAIERVGGDAGHDALVRVRPARVVWWEGWTSGSARVA